ncbi:hypothetical protein ACH5RR_018821 [Cinchona calisaya]|uniref:WPP domain-associated protein n=1 Tax=Cinchona calisaya TaxID=153742 RepID=A0ABD2ZQB9_9GENT
MDDIFGEINCRSKSDAIVMRLLRSAMDEAHEKVQSKNGPIEFLHERSKFYELAAILVDGGLNIVEEEADIQETSREKMLSDLTEIKDWLQRRIEEMKILIIEKDKELMERVENELKISHALELNDRELAFLREKLEGTERAKSEDIPDCIQRNQETDQDEVQGGDIGELKNSVDQQVSNIKQKLEDERKILTRRIRGRSSRSSDSELYSKLFDEEIRSGSGWIVKDDVFGDNPFPGIKSLKSSLNPGKNDVMIQQMSSDIDILKGTLDLAFGRMQNAEAFPLEKEWRWGIEKDTILVSVKGFINDIQKNFKAEFEIRGCSVPVGISKMNWTELINNVRDLHDELNALSSQSEVEEKGSNMHDLSGPLASLMRTTSEPLPEVFFKVPEKDSDPSGGHYVAKMVKNHESFIEKQRESEDWSWLAREILRKKGPSSVKRDKDPDEMESRIQKVITRLDNLLKWDGNIGDDKAFCDSTTVCTEIGELKQERDDLRFHILIIEEIYSLLFKGYAKSPNLELFNDHNDRLIGTHSHSLATNDGKDDDGVKIDNLHDAKSGKLEEESACQILQHYLESTIRENVQSVYFHETVLEWSTNMERNADDCLVKEEIRRIVFGESMQCIKDKCNSLISRLQMETEGYEALMTNHPCSDTVPETIGSLLKEDVYVVYFRELFNAWRTEIDDCYMEMLIKEDIYKFVMVETVKESYVTNVQSKTSDQMTFYKDFLYAKKLDIHEEENLIEKPDQSRFEHSKKEEMVSTSGLTKEHSEQCDEVADHNNMELLSNDDERIFSKLFDEKLGRSFDSFLKSKALVSDIEDNSSTRLKDQNKDDHQAQVHPIKEVEPERRNASYQPEENEVFRQNPSVFSPLIEFQQVLIKFEHVVHKKLECNSLRVDKLKHQINALALPVASTRKKKLIYKKAFITRCHNLRLAENEVDLLGNQVDKLLCLLQNIYLILRQNSTVLSQYFGVFDMLKLIKKELSEGAACFPTIDT